MAGFADLVAVDLLTPTVDEHGRPTYRVNTANPSGWQRAVRGPSPFEDLVLRPLNACLQSSFRGLFWLVTVGIAAVISALVAQSMTESHWQDLLQSRM